MEVISEAGAFISEPIPSPLPRRAAILKGDFMAFESRKLAIEEVIGALKDPKINAIGVYGIGGIGKTSLIKEVSKQVENDQLFHSVLMVAVPQTLDIRKIQGEVAAMIGLELGSEESTRLRAVNLCQSLKEVNRILVILDELWEGIELSDVGIPCGREHMSCKILFTTRLKEVCDVMGSSEDQSTKIFNLGILTENEGWDLFKWNAGLFVDSPTFKDAAKEVARECGGLPLALVTVGRALRGKEDIKIWEKAADELKKSRTKQIRGIHERVLSCLEWSYHQLLDEETKQLFLLSCLFPEDYNVSVEMLVEYAIGEGLFADVETMEEARHRAQSIISNLKDCFFLLNEEENEKFSLGDTLDIDIGCVRIHDVIRDMGISIATSSMVRARQGLKDWPRNSTDGEDYHRRVSLMHNRVLKFPNQLKYPELQTLLLQNNCPWQLQKDEMITVPNTFFEGMPALKVLDLTENHISVLPPSLYSLTNLRTLRLHCRQTELYGLGELRKLQILVLQIHSNNTVVLKDMEQLTTLRLLNLQCRWGSIVIPPEKILNFSKLEELYMKSNNKFVMEQKPGGEITIDVSNSFAEITRLPCLTALQIGVNNVECLPQEVSCHPNWTRFCIGVGMGTHYGRYVVSTTMKISRSLILNNTQICNLPDWFRKGVLLKAELLHFCYFREDLKNIFEESDQEYLSEGGFKLLIVENCPWIECFLNVMEWNLKQTVLFHHLEELRLIGLEDLRHIWLGQLPNGSFKKLKFLSIENCGKLRNLFSPALAESLSQMETIIIRECEALEEIVVKEEETVVEEKIVFPRLKILVLEVMKSITSFYRGNASVECPRLEKVRLVKCENMKNFTLRLQNTPKLKIFEGENFQLYESDVNAAIQSLYEFPQVWRLFSKLEKPLRDHLKQNLQEEGAKIRLDELKKYWQVDSELSTLSSFRDKEVLQTKRWSIAARWLAEFEHNLISLGLLRSEEIPEHNMQFLKTRELLYQLIQPFRKYFRWRYNKSTERQELRKQEKRWRDDPELKTLSSSSPADEALIRISIAERWQGDYEHQLISSGLVAAGCTTEHIRQFPQVLKLVQPAKNSLGNERELPIPAILLEEGYDPESESIVYKRLELEDLMKRWQVDPELINLSLSWDSTSKKWMRRSIAKRWRAEFLDYMREFRKIHKLFYRSIKPLLNYLQWRERWDDLTEQALRQYGEELRKCWFGDPELIRLISSSADEATREPIRGSIVERWLVECENSFIYTGLLPVGCTTEHVRQFLQVVKFFVRLMNPLANYINWRGWWNGQLKESLKELRVSLHYNWIVDPELMKLSSSPDQALKKSIKRIIAERWRIEYENGVVSLGLLPAEGTPEHINEFLQVLELLQPVMRPFSFCLGWYASASPIVRESLEKRGEELLKRWEVDPELITLSLSSDEALKKSMRWSIAERWQAEFMLEFVQLENDLLNSGHYMDERTFGFIEESKGNKRSSNLDSIVSLFMGDIQSTPDLGIQELKEGDEDDDEEEEEEVDVEGEGEGEWEEEEEEEEEEEVEEFDDDDDEEEEEIQHASWR